MLQGKCIKTPPLKGTILPGVTRASILELAAAKGYTVEETNVSIEEALASDEVFTTGTVTFALYLRAHLTTIQAFAHLNQILMLGVAELLDAGGLSMTVSLTVSSFHNIYWSQTVGCARLHYLAIFTR